MAASHTAPRFSVVLPGLVLFVAVALAYANTFSVPFVFDDIAAVTQNPSLARLSTALSPPDGLSVTGRPLINLTLAFNYAVSGEAAWSYHALNLTLHLANTLLLFLLIRRTLTLPSRDTVAWTATAVWSLHPLHTATVTYVMQRSELLVSFCFLLTLYAFARGTRPWLIVSAVACLLGMASKEVMVSAPLILLLYDRTFVSGSFGGALRQHPRFYSALAATWVLLATLVFGTENRGASAGLLSSVAWTDYALTQVYAVPHYLRLAVWPAPLVFDYGTPLVLSPTLLIPGALFLLLLVISTFVALRRWPAVGFTAVAFFALLAPSSSIVPIATQTIAEHRIYLALAAPLVLVAVAGGPWLSITVIPIALALGAATFVRNTDYRSHLVLWQDTAAKAPGNPRAHFNLGLAQLDAGLRPEALASFAVALQLDPNHTAAREKLGAALLADRRPADALPHLEAWVRLAPATAAAHYSLANALIQLSRVADAAPHYAEAVRLAPAHAAARYNLGNALAQLGRYDEALAHFDEAARLDPADTSARANAARIRAYLGR